jgi:hypothetical protein
MYEQAINYTIHLPALVIIPLQTGAEIKKLFWFQ